MRLKGSPLAAICLHLISVCFLLSVGQYVSGAPSAADAPLITGTYKDADGTPLVDVPCVAYDNTKSRPYYATTNSKDASFTIPNYFTGSVTLMFSGPHCNPDFYSNYQGSASNTLNLTAHSRCLSAYVEFRSMLDAAKKWEDVPPEVTKMILDEKTIERVERSIPGSQENPHPASVDKQKQKLDEDVAALREKWKK